MKLVSAIVRPSKLDDVLDALSAIGVKGVTATEVKGFGRQDGHTEVYRAAEYEVTFIPKVKIDIAIPDNLLGQVIEAVGNAARTGKISDGKIVVSALERAVRIRTGETNDAAL
ncbi:MAG TPA: P-II family nitrogen regulator [Burkholderiales bacterium]|jgi:nitrogen regulatory protein P-II 2|nr:P-II family nitrogen regulator [Burkholderiales bacterium]